MTSIYHSATLKLTKYYNALPHVLSHVLHVLAYVSPNMNSIYIVYIVRVMYYNRIISFVKKDKQRINMLH